MVGALRSEGMHRTRSVAVFASRDAHITGQDDVLVCHPQIADDDDASKCLRMSGGSTATHRHAKSHGCNVVAIHTAALLDTTGESKELTADAIGDVHCDGGLDDSKLHGQLATASAAEQKRSRVVHVVQTTTPTEITNHDRESNCLALPKMRAVDSAAKLRDCDMHRPVWREARQTRVDGG